MRRTNHLKQHIISMRISAEEFATLREAMDHLQCRRVSDLMREAFKLMLVPPPSFETAAKGADEVG